MKSPAAERAQARSELYGTLSLAFLYPEQGSAALLKARANELSAWTSEFDWRQVAEVLNSICGAIESLDDRELLEQYIDIFGHSVSGDCPPYAGEYGQAHVFQKTQTLANLASFYRAFGMRLNPGLKDRPDHVSVEMEFMQLLTLKEAYARVNNHGRAKTSICRKAQKAFLTQHLSPWISEFTSRLRRKTSAHRFYPSFAGLLEAFMKLELKSYGIDSVSTPVENIHSVPVDDEGCEASLLTFDAAQEGSCL
ncbi:MAG: molecular chaperone TorD family protein [Dehalococcoidia bacterium]